MEMMQNKDKRKDEMRMLLKMIYMYWMYPVLLQMFCIFSILYDNTSVQKTLGQKTQNKIPGNHKLIIRS